MQHGHYTTSWNAYEMLREWNILMYDEKAVGEVQGQQLEAGYHFEVSPYT